MGGPDLPETPVPLKSIQPYLKIANEHDQRDPVVSYWCRLYALQTGLKLSTKTGDETAFLLKLMDWLEATKKASTDNEAITNDVAAQAHLENWALKLFLYADKNDRASNFGKNVVQSFYTAGLLYDVLTTFGELSEEAAQNKKYAKWKAAYIHNCLKNGETPIPGPLKDGDDDNSNENIGDTSDNEDNEDNENIGTSAQPTLPSQPPMPLYPMQPLIPSQPTPPNNVGAFDFPSVPGHEKENETHGDGDGNNEETAEEGDNDTTNQEADENNDESAEKEEDNEGEENKEESANEENDEPNNDADENVEETAEDEGNKDDDGEEKPAENEDGENTENGDTEIDNNGEPAEDEDNKDDDGEENPAENEEGENGDTENDNNEESAETGDNQDKENNEPSAEQNTYNPTPTPTNPPANTTQTVTITSEAGVELTPEQSIKAQKYIKWAGSALNYDDLPTSILNLKKALHLLTTGQDPA